MFQLDMKSGKSVYEQVVDKIKELIITGALPEESKLPSVRELSRQLTINPNTVQKAFRELDRDGYIYTITGRGTFVSPRSEIRTDIAKVKEVLADIGDGYKQLIYLGLDMEEAREMVNCEIDSIIENSKGRSL